MSAQCETCGRFVPTDTHSVKIHGPRCIAKHEANAKARIERLKKKHQVVTNALSATPEIVCAGQRKPRPTTQATS